MVYVNLTPTPKTSISNMFGQATMKKFLAEFAKVSEEEFEIQGINMTKVSRNLFK